MTPSDVKYVTQAVNGWVNHLANRQTYFTHALCALNDQVHQLPQQYSPLNPDAWAEYEAEVAEKKRKMGDASGKAQQKAAAPRYGKK
ncbi:hypothetical protein [Cupriavidus basilensis]|uniref:hypothetical protein n=1 Tax=Cupriavidus basilensis TaxID=68895 RepID=UPI0023E8549D|nr:hypothetical protein [Cupriavidus basilensis]MDF3887888.1 hypothetical protein [Cupriavidus basilensis]